MDFDTIKSNSRLNNLDVENCGEITFIKDKKNAKFTDYYYLVYCIFKVILILYLGPIFFFTGSSKEFNFSNSVFSFLLICPFNLGIHHSNKQNLAPFNKTMLI